MVVDPLSESYEDFADWLAPRLVLAREYDAVARTNKTVGQLYAGEEFSSHNHHPEDWAMVCRDIGGVRCRRLSDNREAVVSHHTKVFSWDRVAPCHEPRCACPAGKRCSFFV